MRRRPPPPVLFPAGAKLPPSGSDDARKWVAVLGVFRYTHKHPDSRRPKVHFELRIVLVLARTEAEARRFARREFRGSEGKSWASPGHWLKIEYLGIRGVQDMVFLDDGEVWWSFVDERPSVVEDRAGNPVRTRRARRRPARSARSGSSSGTSPARARERQARR